MGRKKKVQAPEKQKKEEETVQTAPDLVAPPPQNGQAKAAEDPPELLAMIKARAVEVAKECGLREPFLLGGPDRVDYPQRGHGYIVTVKEQTGKGRMGSARFNSEGEHRYWSQDSLITG